jgi:caffeoyl-CoA O-methyltransferase
MSIRTLQLSDELHQYLIDHTLRDHPLLRELREETARLPMGHMQISPEQGQFMQLLGELVGCRRYLEIGTFTGYSSLCMALSMPQDGRLICCDISTEYTNTARRYWQRAGVESKITLKLQPAIQTLQSLISGDWRPFSDLGETANLGKFDFVFLDADKQSYDAYFEPAIALLRPGGLLAVDNALRRGFVADPTNSEPDTLALRAINDRVCRDSRLTQSLVPIGDGLLLARKR